MSSSILRLAIFLITLIILPIISLALEYAFLVTSFFYKAMMLLTDDEPVVGLIDSVIGRLASPSSFKR